MKVNYNFCLLLAGNLLLLPVAILKMPAALENLMVSIASGLFISLFIRYCQELHQARRMESESDRNISHEIYSCHRLRDRQKSGPQMHGLKSAGPRQKFNNL